MTVALASGMWRMVWKNKVNADHARAPDDQPLSVVPKRGSPLRQSQMRKKTG